FAPEAPVHDEELLPGRSSARLFELADPLPKVFVSKAPMLSPNERDAILRIAAAASRSEALQVVDDPLQRLDGAPLPSGKEASVLDAEWSAPDAATVRLAGTGGAVVGLRTPFLVGWTAEQAGEPVPVIRIAGHQLGAAVTNV